MLFTASSEPTERHLWSYDTGNGVVRLSDEVGVHVGVQRADTTVLVSGAPDRPGQTVTVRMAGLADGRPRQQIASHAEPPVLDVRRKLMSLGPSELRSALFLPSWYSAGDRPLPVLLDPYAGPAAGRHVTRVLDPCWPRRPCAPSTCGNCPPLDDHPDLGVMNHRAGHW